MADHGEGGLSHGMREKAYTVYEEMVHIPLIVHNPKLFPEPVQTEAFYDHLDLLPTILDLAGIPDPNSYALGHSIVPVIKNPSAAVKEHTAFSFDDLFFLPIGFPGAHIRAIREGGNGPMRLTSAWTVAVSTTSCTTSKAIPSSSKACSMRHPTRTSGGNGRGCIGC